MSGALPVLRREAVRVILLNPHDRVLLSHDVFEGHDHWALPGGGIEDGETPEKAAIRELVEETGLTDVALGPLVARHRFRAEMFGVDLDQRELIFLGRTAGGPVDTSGLVGLEREFMTGFRWWTADELETTTAVVLPEPLPRLVRRIVEHGPPERPWSSRG